MENTRRNFIKKTVGMASVTALTPMLSYGQEFLYTSPHPLLGHIFLTKPYLQNPGSNQISINWIMNLPSYSFVEYGSTKELNYTAKKIDSGLVVAYNRINSITLKNLSPGTQYYYRIVSKEITKFDPYNLEYGKIIKSEVYSFNTPIKDQEEVSMIILNDIHDRPESIPHLMSQLKIENPDCVFFNGDVFDHQEDEEQIIKHMLIPCGETFSTQVPFYFVRGNHETRGKFARNLHCYFTNPNNEQYYSFIIGSTHFTVIDTGEDKPDDTQVYANIVDFDAYREEQLHWFDNISKSKDFKKAKFRVVLMHIPPFYSGDWHGTMHLRKLFAKVFNSANIDMCISGHTHRYGVHKPVEGKHNYPIIIGGGPKKDQRTIIHLMANQESLSVSMIRDDGNEVGKYTLR